MYFFSTSIWGSGFRVQGLGLGFRALYLGFRVKVNFKIGGHWGLGFRVQGWSAVEKSLSVQLVKKKLQLFSFYIRNENSCHCPNITKYYTFVTLKLNQCCKSGSIFSSSKPVAACCNCSRLWHALCLIQAESDPPKLCWSAAPKALPLILQSSLLLSSGMAIRSNPSQVPCSTIGIVLQYQSCSHPALSYWQMTGRILEGPQPPAGPCLLRALHLAPGFHARNGQAVYTRQAVDTPLTQTPSAGRPLLGIPQMKMIIQQTSSVLLTNHA